MKKIEKYIYIVIALIFVAVLASGITYIVMDKQNDKTEIKDNEPSNKENENEKSEQITLSESKLKEYLNYVPRDILNEKQNVYIKPSNIDNLSKKVLLGATINYASEFTTLKKESETGDEYLFEKSAIKQLMYKLYNIDLEKIDNLGNIQIEYSCGIYTYANNFFKQSGGCDFDGSHLNVIEKYEINNTELIIYEYATIVYPEEGEDYVAVMEDYYTKHKTYLGMPCIESENDYSCYFKDNYKDYSLYKHTFKKNNTGYYWYKTEVTK